jgi:hypothetical protein
MRKTTYFCDGCGAAKGEANRWLLGRKFKATFDAVFYGLAASVPTARPTQRLKGRDRRERRGTT